LHGVTLDLETADRPPLEVCINERATGRLIGVQVRSGQSYFAARGEKGFVFKEEDQKHLNYWLGHSLPVIAVIVDPQRQIGWWQLVDDSNVEVIGVGWKMNIPFSNQLLAESAHQLMDVAGYGRVREVTANMIAKRFHDLSQLRVGLLHEAFAFARRSIYVATPLISADILAVLEYVSQHAHVRVLLGEAQDESVLKLTAELRSDRFQIRCLPQLHLKALIVDDYFLFVSSAGMTRSSWNDLNPESMMPITDPGEIRAESEAFLALWDAG
jgi:phosphatidylserine/phosphatidylglycerophosphate/cardiolipin synthase-like enzyme